MPAPGLGCRPGCQGTEVPTEGATRRGSSRKTHSPHPGKESDWVSRLPAHQITGPLSQTPNDSVHGAPARAVNRARRGLGSSGMEMLLRTSWRHGWASDPSVRAARPLDSGAKPGCREQGRRATGAHSHSGNTSNSHLVTGHRTGMRSPSQLHTYPTQAALPLRGCTCTHLINPASTFW